MINRTETVFRPNHRTRVFALIAFMVLCLIISAAGGAVTATSVNDWYPTLQKPFFNPPNWLFGPAWSLIYFLIAFSGWRVWLKRGIDGAKGPFAVYARTTHPEPSVVISVFRGAIAASGAD
jgi:tryptophan-rich sensory protein